MDVILDASDLDGMHPVFLGDASEICPDTLFDARCDPAFPAFRAENEVVMEGCVGVGHKVKFGENCYAIHRLQPSRRDDEIRGAA